MKPVRPRQEFVHGLSRRIRTRNRAAFVNNIANWHILAVLIAGFVSVAVVLAMMARALLALAGKKRAA